MNATILFGNLLGKLTKMTTNVDFKNRNEQLLKISSLFCFLRVDIKKRLIEVNILRTAIKISCRVYEESAT